MGFKIKNQVLLFIQLDSIFLGFYKDFTKILHFYKTYVLFLHFFNKFRYEFKKFYLSFFYSFNNIFVS